MKRFLDLFSPLIGLIGVTILFGVLKPHTFLTADNLRLMLVQTTIVAVVALGMTYVIITGGIDLSVGSTLALSSCTCAILLVDDPARAWDGWSVYVAVPVAILVGGLIGLFNGLLITKARLLPFIVTLATLASVRGIAQGVTGQNGVYPRQDTFPWLSRAMTAVGVDVPVVSPSVVVVLIAAALFAVTLRYTRFGRHVVAVGSNEHTARLCGVRIDAVKTWVYVLVGLCAGVAGVMRFGSLSMGDPTTGQGEELNVIAAVVIGGASLSGGRGTILGTLAGAMIITVVNNGCVKLGLQNWVQQIITGGIIIGAVLLDRVRRLGAK